MLGVDFLAAADPCGKDQGGDPGIDVDDQATGKVNRPEAGEEAVRCLNHVDQRVVDEDRPADREDD